MGLVSRSFVTASQDKTKLKFPNVSINDEHSPKFLTMDNCTVNGEVLNGTNDTPDFHSTAAEFLVYKIGMCDFIVYTFYLCLAK